MLFSKKKFIAPYLAGLIEGDGCFYTPKALRNKKGLKVNPRIAVAFCINDLPLAKFFKKNYGGSLTILKNKTSCTWFIQSKKDMFRICTMINGFLRTPKINDFCRFIKFSKDQKILEFKDFEVQPLDTSALDSNSWLAGYTDADGYFGLTILTGEKYKKPRVCTDFAITSKTSYGGCIKKELMTPQVGYFSFKPILSTIAEFLGLSLYRDKRRKVAKRAYVVRSPNLISRRKVLDYFEFNLQSSKRLNCQDWGIVVRMQCTKEHLTPKGIETCFEIKSRLNTKRILFDSDWAHLEELQQCVNLI